MVVAVTGFDVVVVEPRMLVIVLVEDARSVLAEELALEVGAVVPVRPAIELTSDEGAIAEVTELSVPVTELTGAVTVFKTGNDDTVVVSESTVAGIELTVEVTEFTTGVVTAVVIGSNTDGSAATVPVSELTTGSDATVFVKVLSVAGRVVVIELTTGNELTVFVKLSSVVGTVPATLLTVELSVELGVARRTASTGVDVVVVAVEVTEVIAGAGSTSAGAGSGTGSGARFVGDVVELVAEAVGATAVGVEAVIRAN